VTRVTETISSPYVITSVMDEDDGDRPTAVPRNGSFVGRGKFLGSENGKAT
jgi:hypothetical protein